MDRHPMTPRLIIALLIAAALIAVGLVDWLAHAHICIDCCGSPSC